MMTEVRGIMQIAAFAMCSTAVHAGTLSVRVDPPDALKIIRKSTAWNIVLEGEIDSEAPSRVKAALQKTGLDGADVYINSLGGNLFVGMEIGRLIRRTGANTHVGTLVADISGGALARVTGRKAVKAKPGYCYSACSLAFLGGVHRYVPPGSEYGVHQFSSRSSPAESNLDTTQVASAAVTAYIRDMDVDPALFNVMLQKGKDGIRIFSDAELVRLNVVNTGRKN
jgi:hypothetical protein